MNSKMLNRLTALEQRKNERDSTGSIPVVEIRADGSEILLWTMQGDVTKFDKIVIIHDDAGDAVTDEHQAA